MAATASGFKILFCSQKPIYIVRDLRRGTRDWGIGLHDMDQLMIVDAIGKHMDLLEKISIWALFLGLAIGWAGLQKKDITVLGITFARREAFRAAAAVYLFAEMILVILFLRIGDLLYLADEAMFPQAFTKLTTHTWILNPYSYFGSGGWSRTYNCEGIGLLIALWWLSHASLSTLIVDGVRKRGDVILIRAFLALGIAGLFFIARVFWIVQTRGATFLPANLYEPFSATIIYRSLAALLAIGIGVLLYRAKERIGQYLS